MKINKKDKLVLLALANLNKYKEIKVAFFLDEYQQSKNTILNYIVNKYNLEPEIVIASPIGNYIAGVVDEIIIDGFGFHYNPRLYSGDISKLKPLDRTIRNDARGISFSYSIYIIYKYLLTIK